MSEKKMAIWPLKGLPTDDGLLCMYDADVTGLSVSDELSVMVLGSEWVVLVDNRFCVPVRLLGLGSRDSCLLRLAGSVESEIEAKVFAALTLDIRAMTKIELLTESAPL